MAGLVFAMPHRGVVNVSQLGKSNLAVKLHSVVALLDIVAAISISRELFHFLVAGFRFGAIKQTPGPAASDELKSRIHDSQPTAVLKTGVEVSDLAQLRNDPALVNKLLITLQLLR